LHLRSTATTNLRRYQLKCNISVKSGVIFLQNQTTRLDFIIIGSGVSGSRIAYELARSGARCLLLEAGKAYQDSTFPKNELDSSSQLFWGGGIEVSQDGTLGFLRAKCLGGTSVVNQALLNRFDELAFQDWKSRSGIAYFSTKEMAPFYDEIEKNLSVNSIAEEHFNLNSQIFIVGFNKLGYQWEPLHRAQKDCKLEKGTDCIVCLGGCPRNSKQSALVTTIPWAKSKGLEIKTEVEVHSVIHEKDFVRVLGYGKGSKIEFIAKKVVLASGTFGNTTILLRSGYQEKLPALGSAFSCHPQYMTYALFEDRINSHKGAFQAVEGSDAYFREQGLKFENVFAPPIATAMLLPGFGQSHQKLMKKYGYFASIEVAIRDEPVGKIKLNSNGKIQIQKPLTDLDKKKAKQGLEIVKDVFEESGAKEVFPCMQGFGLHLMGGCPMGSNPTTSVVGSDFKVHGYPHMYVADSSIFPTAPGINPSFTIMALSLKASQEMLKAL